ncbi:MAG: ribonuclease P protein component [Chloroflexi bacterium]|nr:ribonuclease P protein component [Chloroflexota bacterium]
MAATAVRNPRPHGFPPDKRLRKQGEFTKAYTQGRLWSQPSLRLRVVPNQLQVSRFGFVASKHLGGAVVRNRFKRRMREIVRLAGIRAGFDIVVIARPPAALSSYQVLREELYGLLRRARLLDTQEPAASQAPLR